MWWVFYLFSVAASGEWINWTGLGFLLLTPVFTGSIRLTESISAERYPSYAEYRAATPCLIPGLRRRPASTVSDDDPDLHFFSLTEDRREWNSNKPLRH